jgi:hypothetical protein
MGHSVRLLQSDEEMEAVSATTRSDERQPGKRLALLIASWEYQDAEFAQLRAPGQDAERLARVLSDPEIGGFEVRMSLNQPAHAVGLAIEDFFSERGRDDLLLLYFSCHGVKHQSGRLYFATSTTRRDRLAATAVSSEFVKEQIDHSLSRRVLVLLDCCYSGAFTRGLTAKSDQYVDLTEPFDGRGRVVLTASSSTEYAFEGQELTKENPEPSIFTSALIEGLETGAADRDQDGRISADELYDYVFDQVRERTPYQTPTKAVSSVQGKLYVARNRQPVRPPELPAELRQAITNPLASLVPGPRAFISFDFNHDQASKNLFVGQANSESPTPFTIADWSSKSDLPQGQWAAIIKAKINRCHLMIILVGRYMDSATGVAKEIEFARAGNVPFFGVYVDGANSNSTLPPGLARNRTIAWTWPGIAKTIDQMMPEEKNR